MYVDRFIQTSPVPVQTQLLLLVHTNNADTRWRECESMVQNCDMASTKALTESLARRGAQRCPDDKEHSKAMAITCQGTAN